MERTDGSVKIGPALAQRLAATLPTWARSVAPYAVQVAHEFGRVVAGKWEPRTPLTGRKAKAAAAVVKARKADAAEKGRRSAAVRADTSAPTVASFARCVDCGGALARPRHLRCSTCWERQPGQSADMRRRRGSAISVARSAQEKWKRENPDAITDPDDFRRWILPGLKGVALSQIMAATGCTKATASSYRTGKTTPHPMHSSVLLLDCGSRLLQFRSGERFSREALGRREGGANGPAPVRIRHTGAGANCLPPLHCSVV